MKIFDTAAIRELDAVTIAREQIPSTLLMERASQAFVERFTELYDAEHPVFIFCGPGNNGGDGLVISRLLFQKGYRVDAWVLYKEGPASKDFSVNYLRLKPCLATKEFRTMADFPLLPENAVIIDALFGSGLSRPLEGLAAELVERINLSGLPVISVDIASGLFADHSSQREKASIIQPYKTISFQLPKLAFMMPENEDLVGDWEAVPIGLNQEWMEEKETPYHFILPEMIYPLLKKRKKYAHKGSFGHALLLLGSHGKMGAAILSARAALRAGLGLLTVHVPACGYEIIQISVPEAMATVDEAEHYISQLPEFPEKGYQALGIGPGIGQAPETQQLLLDLLRQANSPLVLDADALNLLSQDPAYIQQIPPHSILTPHVKEFARLTRPAENDFERLELLRDFASTHLLYVILKGANTAIATPQGDVYFNATGNPGMASAGSGDVLTGMLTALLAQGYRPEESAILGVYLHGLAGDYALYDNSYESLTASSIIDNISEAFRSVSRN
ncbi:MAG: NAD(P)H-hydrate dehydratase [Bacteroidota bacterium]